MVTKLLARKKVVSCKWIFTMKYNSDGSVNRFKARLVLGSKRIHTILWY